MLLPLHQLERRIERSQSTRKPKFSGQSRPIISAPILVPLSTFPGAGDTPQLARARSLNFVRKKAELKRSHTTKDVVTLVTVKAGDVVLIPSRPLLVAKPEKMPAEFDRALVYLFDSVSTSGRLLDRLDLDDDSINDVTDDFDYVGEIASIMTAPTRGAGAEDDIEELEENGGVCDSSDEENTSYETITQPKLTSLRKPLEIPPRLSLRKPLVPVAYEPPAPSTQLPLHMVVGQQPQQRTLQRLAMLIPPSTMASESPRVYTADKRREYGIEIPKVVSNRDYTAALIRNVSLEDAQEFPKPDEPKLEPPVLTGTAPHHVYNQVKQNYSADSFRVDIGTTRPLVSIRGHAHSGKATVVLKDLPQEPGTGLVGKELTKESVGLQLPFQHKQRSRDVNGYYPPKKPATLRLVLAPVVSSKTTQNTLITLEMTPEARTKLALQFRNIGKHREALYQLQIAANQPHNFPKAMFLYAMALRFGLGVKKNDRHCIKWLGKCILMYSQLKALSDIVDKLNSLQSEDLVKLILKKLAYDFAKDPVNNGVDPFKLFNQMSRLSKTDILKIANTSKNQSDILAVAYFEMANALINEWGINHRDELQGMKLLGKAAAMGYVQAMLQLGEMWATKTKFHKKDLNLAAAWLRLLEVFGAKLIGNSWIYKDKYMKRK